MLDKRIFYKGEEFAIEWYFDLLGKSKARDYFYDLTKDRQKKALHLAKLLGDMGKLFNEEKFIHEGDKIYAIKPSPDRFLCFFFDGSKIIITNAYEKKSQKMPAKEKDMALRYMHDYIKRCKDGTYYVK